MQGKRSEVQKKKQIIFLVFVGAALIAAAAGLFWKYGRSKMSGSFRQSGREQTIQYDGKTYQYNDHLSNYLFMGVDTRDSVETYETQRDAGQADAIFLVSYDRAERTLKCLMIPRDTITKVEIFNLSGESKGLTEDHINIQYAFGDGKAKSCELMEEAVSRLLYQVPVQGYCSLNMDGIPVMTEIIGGVELIVPDDSLAEVNPEFTQGAQVTIAGENAEQFVRYRDIGKSQSAITRMNRQKVFLQAYVSKAQETATQDTALITRLYDGVQDYMVTNMGTDLFADLLEASYGSETEVETLPGEGVEGESFDEYIPDDDQLYEMIIRMFYKEVQD